MTKHKVIDISRKDFHINQTDDVPFSNEIIQISALMRIADATEIISADHNKMKKRIEYLEKRNNVLQDELTRAHNRIRSYKRQITKLKNTCHVDNRI